VALSPTPARGRCRNPLTQSHQLRKEAIMFRPVKMLLAAHWSFAVKQVGTAGTPTS